MNINNPGAGNPNKIITNNNHNKLDKPNKKVTEEGKINALPNELLQKALSYLENDEIKQAGTVNHHWNKNSFEVIKREEHSKTIEFIKQVGDTLNQDIYKESIYKKAGEMLHALFSKEKILDSVDLTEFKYSLGELEEDVLNILKILPEKELNELAKSFETKGLPACFDNIFGKAISFQHLDKVLAGAKPEEIENLFQWLIQDKLLNTALALAKIAPDDKKLEFFITIITVQPDLDKCKKLVEESCQVNGMEQTRSFLLEACESLLFEDSIDEAEKIISLMPDEKSKQKASKKLHEYLMHPEHIIENKGVDEAVKFITRQCDQIPNEKVKNKILLSFSKELAEDGHPKKALELTKLMSEETKIKALKSISKWS